MVRASSLHLRSSAHTRISFATIPEHVAAVRKNRSCFSPSVPPLTWSSLSCSGRDIPRCHADTKRVYLQPRHPTSFLVAPMTLRHERSQTSSSIMLRKETEVFLLSPQSGHTKRVESRPSSGTKLPITPSIGLQPLTIFCMCVVRNHA